MSKHISYLSETFDDYLSALDGVKSLDDLRAVVATYRRFANDAFRVVSAMHEREWPAFRKGLRLERKQKFAGMPWAEKYGAVLLPEVMLRVAAIALKFKVPWGCAFIRAKDIGMIIERDGIARFAKEAA